VRVTSNPCPHCQSRITVTVNRHEWERWSQGYGYIQDILPNRDESERFITRLCPAGLDLLVGYEKVE